MLHALGELDGVDVLLFSPGIAPAPASMPNRTSKPAMTPGRAAMLALASAYLDTGLGGELTTLELQKLAYFMQAAGERLNLRFVQHHYGPYADALRKVLEVMEGHYITGLGDDATRPDTAVELLEGARESAERTLVERPDTRRAIERVLRLIEGFEDLYGLELLSTTSVKGHTASTTSSLRWTTRTCCRPPRAPDVEDVTAYALGLMPDFEPVFMAVARTWRGPSTELKHAILREGPRE